MVDRSGLTGARVVALPSTRTRTNEADNLAMAISLVASTRGVALLPIYAENFLPRSVVSRPIKGKAPTIELTVAHHKANASPVLRLFLSRVDELIARVSRRHGEAAKKMRASQEI